MLFRSTLYRAGSEVQADGALAIMTKEIMELTEKFRGDDPAVVYDDLVPADKMIPGKALQKPVPCIPYPCSFVLRSCSVAEICDPQRFRNEVS